MFENIVKFFKNLVKDKKVDSKDTAKERLHLVLMQDRANVSADFLELMKQEIIDVIKKYIDVDESSIDVKLTNKTNGDGTTGAPILYANIPIVSIKDENKNKVINENAKKEENHKGTSNIENNKDTEKETQKEKQEQNKDQKENKKQEDNVQKEEKKDKEDEKEEEKVNVQNNEEDNIGEKNAQIDVQDNEKVENITEDSISK